MSTDPPQVFPQTKKSHTALIVWTVVGGGGLCVLLCAGIFLRALGTARQSVREMKSSTQIHEIARALMMYANENDGALPEVRTGWEQRLRSGGWVNDQWFESPSSTPGVVSYIYVPHGKLTADENTLLLYENPALNTKAYSVAFDDMHVETVSKDRLLQIISGLPPAAQPPK